MSNRPNAATSRQLARARRPRGPSPTALLVIGCAVVVATALIVAIAVGNKSTNDQVATGPDAAAIINQVTSVPAGVFDTVGAGTAAGKPKVLSGDPLSVNGKPEVLYIGAEYCPYCATERWAMVAALSRFGTFSNLSLTRSSSIDVYPSTPTFTFHGSGFVSNYLTFTPVETQTNEPSPNGGYKPLDTLTAGQQQLVSSLGSGIPFIDIAGKYLINGVTYDPGVLQGKTGIAIATALRDGKSPISTGVIGSANLLTALICQTTGGQPATVCDTPGVRAASIPTN